MPGDVFSRRKIPGAAVQVAAEKASKQSKTALAGNP